MTDEILVLHHGRIVERGVTKDVLQHPKDDYTVGLLDAVANPYAAVPSDAPAGEASTSGNRTGPPSDAPPADPTAAQPAGDH